MGFDTQISSFLFLFIHYSRTLAPTKFKRMRFRFQNIFYAIVLLLFLGVPFGIKNIDPRLEMFPAVILPSGSSKYPLDVEYRMPIHEMYARTPNGTEKKVEHPLFFRPIPLKNSQKIIGKKFGLKPSKSHQFKTVRLGLTLELDPKVSEKDIEATKIWMRDKLREQGFQDSILIIRKEQFVIAVDGSYYKDSTVLNDTIFKLY